MIYWRKINFIILAKFTIFLANWKFSSIFSSLNYIKKCTPQMVCIFTFKFLAAAFVPHQDQSFSVLIVFQRQTFCIVDDMGFNRNLNFINNCYMIIFFRLFQSQTNLRASSAIAAEVDANTISFALCENIFKNVASFI
jgi:hypothetical protein